LATVFLIIAVCIFARGDTEDKLNEKNADSNSHYNCPDHLRIAIVDIHKLFKSHTSFRTKMNQLKAKVDLAEQQLKEDRGSISSETQKAQENSSSSSADQLNALNDRVKKQKAELMHEEEAIYFDTEQDIRVAIKRCCERHQIQLAINVNNSPVDPTDRKDIIRGMDTPIPYFDSALDITEEAAAELKNQTTEQAK
jgi:Outer membrane protein (OmpH-like)